MAKLKIGIVDYGIGNHASVKHCLHELHYRCKVCKDPEELKNCDLLLLPGVGAFAPAMAALKSIGLDQMLIEYSYAGKPLIGICLGMELFAQHSTENGKTKGLGILPGIIDSLPDKSWHIGWNAVCALGNDNLCSSSDSQCFYFNHSYSYQADDCHSVLTSSLRGNSIVAAVRKNNTLGFQFHPEKSQDAGRSLLKRAIDGLCDA